MSEKIPRHLPFACLCNWLEARSSGQPRVVLLMVKSFTWEDAIGRKGDLFVSVVACLLYINFILYIIFFI